MKYLIVICLLLLALPSSADLQTLQGTFVGVEVGDYYHLQIEDVKGQQRSFYMTEDPSFEPFIEQPESNKGLSVQVRWHTTEKDIPEAGGMMTVDEAVSIQFAVPESP